MRESAIAGIVDKQPMSRSEAGKQTSVPPSPKENPGRRAAAQETAKPPRGNDGLRETVESIVVAFILAFLFRTYEAEAFVIPTGSMAPTLLGRHKDVSCNKCGTAFTVGASDEIDDETGYYRPSYRVETAFCPNCRYENNVHDLPAFKGDRILVNKFPYEFGEPDRFDVIVFKFPEQPTTNYIKRLVGLPGEIIRISRGDLYARGSETDEWRVLRKENPDKQRTIQQLVYDNAHAATELHKAGWPERWAPVVFNGAETPETVAGWSRDEDGWEPADKSPSFRLQAGGTADETYQWLRYRHFVPDEQVWDAVEEGRPLDRDPEARLIADNCSYNTYTGGQRHPRDHGFYWVGDLTVSCQVQIDKVAEGGELLLELIEGYHWYRCRIDVQTGKATLLDVDRELAAEDSRVEEIPLATAQTSMTGPGSYHVTFANVDNRLCLWVDGGGLFGDGLVDFGAANTYEAPVLDKPTERDLTPVGIAARGLDVRVSHLRLMRDVYYRSEHVVHGNDYSRRPTTEYEYNGGFGGDAQSKLAPLLSDPERWYEEYSAHAGSAVFKKLGPDEFLVLGDNSPRSKDSRLWSNTRHAARRHAVPRSALVGKAFFIYWPHGEPFLNDGKGFPLTYHKSSPGNTTDYPKFRVPFYPNIGRMHRIR